MKTNDRASVWPGAETPHRSDPGSGSARLIRATAAGLLSVAAVAVAFPTFGQDANRLELCELSGETVDVLQTDVDGVGVDGNPEIAFVVVYSINNDNNGQRRDLGGTTGPILCTNPNLPFPVPTMADTDIDDIDILDSAEAFLLRFEGGTSDPETRFCHTTNANVDCYLLGPLSAGE